MKIVDRKTFLALPPNTLFAKYEPCNFEELSIKGTSLMEIGDFGSQEIVSAIYCKNSEEFVEKLYLAKETGDSLPMDFDCGGRDGCFDEDQLFAVFEAADVRALISRLQQCLPTEN